MFSCHTKSAGSQVQVSGSRVAIKKPPTSGGSFFIVEPEKIASTRLRKARSEFAAAGCPVKRLCYCETETRRNDLSLAEIGSTSR
jgi:hypothetical protein